MNIAVVILIIIIVFHVGAQSVIEEIGSWIKEFISLFKKD